MTCPRCGSQAKGKFCAQCGASLDSTNCPKCGHTPPPGSRFCTRCGEALAGALGASEGGRGVQVAWAAAGILFILLILVVAFPLVNRGAGGGPAQTTPPAAPFAGSGGSGAPPDLSSMTPREAADRLFNRVMQAAESGDSAQAQQFLPMAIGAYERARPLDLDGLFHLTVLQRTALQLEEALATAQTALEQEPTHLLHLNAAAQASAELGNEEAAAAYYQAFLDNYDAEMGIQRTEYLDHSTIIPTMRRQAAEYLSGG